MPSSQCHYLNDIGRSAGLLLSVILLVQCLNPLPGGLGHAVGTGALLPVGLGVQVRPGDLDGLAGVFDQAAFRGGMVVAVIVLGVVVQLQVVAGEPQGPARVVPDDDLGVLDRKSVV